VFVNCELYVINKVIKIGLNLSIRLETTLVFDQINLENSFITKPTIKLKNLTKIVGPVP